jgi:hypothetical protein
MNFVILQRNLPHPFFCVVETEVHKSWVESLVGTLGYDNVFAVSSTGRSGGMAIF